MRNLYVDTLYMLNGILYTHVNNMYQSHTYYYHTVLVISNKLCITFTPAITYWLRPYVINKQLSSSKNYISSKLLACTHYVYTMYTQNFGKFWNISKFPENSGISGKIREFRKIPEKISGISGKTFFGNFRNCKKFGHLFVKFRVFYKNRSAQQCTHSKNQCKIGQI